MKVCTVHGVVASRAGSRSLEHGPSANLYVAVIGVAPASIAARRWAA